ncbi:MAG: hypothetical protein ACREJ3_06235, partial [Polyangiaceae bacterium]
GLRDTVEAADVAHGTGTGIVSPGVDRAALLFACEEAMWLWRDPMGMQSVVARAMARDSSWVTSAEKVHALYEGLWARASHPEGKTLASRYGA